MATAAVNFIEKISRDQIKKELLTGGVNWADVEAMGLQVFLIGNAPNEASRFDALSLASNVVDAERFKSQDIWKLAFEFVDVYLIGVYIQWLVSAYTCTPFFSYEQSSSWTYRSI